MVMNANKQLRCRWPQTPAKKFSKRGKLMVHFSKGNRPNVIVRKDDNIIQHNSQEDLY